MSYISTFSLFAVVICVVSSVTGQGVPPPMPPPMTPPPPPMDPMMMMLLLSGGSDGDMSNMMLMMMMMEATWTPWWWCLWCPWTRVRNLPRTVQRSTMMTGYYAELWQTSLMSISKLQQITSQVPMWSNPAVNVQRRKACSRIVSAHFLNLINF